MTTQVNAKVKIQTPTLVETDDVEEELKNLLTQDYMVLGFNNFEDRMKSKESALRFAKKIGASDVLFSRRFISKKYINYESVKNQNFDLSNRRYLGYLHQRSFERYNAYRYSVVYLVRPDEP